MVLAFTNNYGSAVRKSNSTSTSHPEPELARAGFWGRDRTDRCLLRAALTGFAQKLLAAVAILVLFSGHLYAQAITLTLESVAGGPPMSGSGTNVGSMNLGTVSAFEAIAFMVTRTTGSSSFTISAQFGVKVIRNSGTSPNYTLQCRLQITNPLTWLVNGVPMTTSFATVASGQPYGSIESHTVSFLVPFSDSTGSVAADFELMAIAN